MVFWVLVSLPWSIHTNHHQLRVRQCNKNFGFSIISPSSSTGKHGWLSAYGSITTQEHNNLNWQYAHKFGPELSIYNITSIDLDTDFSDATKYQNLEQTICYQHILIRYSYIFRKNIRKFTTIKWCVGIAIA